MAATVLPDFRKDYTLLQRKATSERILEKYPDRLPIIVLQGKNSNLPPLEKQKYLVPQDLSVGKFIHEVRKHVSLPPEQAIFCFVGDGVLPPTSGIMSQIYERYADEDGFLYFRIAGENVFG